MSTIIPEGPLYRSFMKPPEMFIVTYKNIAHVCHTVFPLIEAPGAKAGVRGASIFPPKIYQI